MTTKNAAPPRVSYNRTIGVAAMQGRGFYYPWDSVVGSNGRLYVLGRALDGDPRGVRVTVLDLEEEYYGTWGSYGTGDGQFVWTSAIIQDSQERMYISDEHLNRVTILSTNGDFLGKWGESGTSDGQLQGPNGMAFNSDNELSIVDHLNNRVQKFTPDGQFISSFGSPGGGDGQFNLPWGIDIAKDGTIYIADWGNDRIQKFTPDGDFIDAYGSSGRGDEELRNPADVSVDGDGYMYIADWANQRVQVLDPDGGFVQSLKGQATISKWAQDFLDVNLEEAAARANSNLEADIAFFDDDPHEVSSHIEKYFWAPTSVNIDSEGHIFIVDSNRHRLQVYDIV